MLVLINTRVFTPQAQRPRVAVLALIALLVSAGCRGKNRAPGTPRTKTDAGAPRAAGGLDGAPEVVPTCGPENSVAPSAAGGSLKLLLAEEPPHLDPLEDPSRATLQVVSDLIYEPLIECRGGRYRPALAERWEWNDDRTHLQVQLRPEVRWEDGQPLTAADVEASLRAVSRDRQSLAAAALAEVKAIEGSTAGTVRLRLASPSSGILDALCEMPIVPAAAGRGGRRKNLREHPIGTGPFRLASWEHGRRIRLVPSPSSWRGRAAVDELLFEIEPDARRGLHRARSGEIDVAEVATRHYPEQVRRAALAPTVSLRRLSEQRLSFLAINHRHSPLSELPVRRALDLLWNRAAGAEELHQGLAQPIADPLAIGPAASFDPKTAARLLGEAGWQDGNGDGVRERQGEVLQIGLLHAAAGGPAEVELRRYSASLFRAGIRLELSAVEPAVLWQRVRSGDFDLAALAWRGRAGEDPSPLLGGNGRFNQGGFRSARVDSLLQRWRQAEPGEGRDLVARELATAVAEEVPAIFLYRHDQVLLVHQRVQGLCSEGGRLDLRRVWLQDERR